MRPGVSDTTDVKRFVSLLRIMLGQLAGHVPAGRLGRDPQRYLDSVINQRVSWSERIGYADASTSRAGALEALVLEMVSGLLQEDLEFDVQKWRAQWRYGFLR